MELWQLVVVVCLLPGALCVGLEVGETFVDLGLLTHTGDPSTIRIAESGHGQPEVGLTTEILVRPL